MPRYSDPQVIDTQAFLDVDRAFIGVDARHDKAALAAGWATEAINMRCRDGVWTTRLGYSKIPWMNNVSVLGIQPWGTTYGTGEFKDADGRRWIIMAAAGNVYACLSNNFPVLLTLPSGVTITSDVYFTQAVDKLYMWRGIDLAPLYMSDLSMGFAAVPDAVQADANDDALSIPNGIRAVFAAGRLWVQAANDEIWPSDVLLQNTYHEINKIAVTQGSADPLVTIGLFGENDIIALKAASVWRISGLNTVDTSTGAPGVLVYITGQYGCIAANTAVDVGTDFVWLSQYGFANITLTIQGEIQSGAGLGSEKAGKISDSFARYFGRLNGANVSKAFAAVWDDKIYLAVPLDNAESFGPELCAQGTLYPTDGTEFVNLLGAGTYRFTMGANEYGIQYPEPATSTHSLDFTWTQNQIDIVATAISIPITASVRKLASGVNNACFVYDLRTGTWNGYDEAEGINFQRLQVTQYLHKDRLTVISSDGWVYLAEDGYVDALPVPYVDVVVQALPDAPLADGITVNGGTHVVAGVNWDLGAGPEGTLATAQQNFWDDGFFNGYHLETYTAPNTAPNKIPGGVRFYSATGILPIIVVTEAGNDWSLITVRDWQPISTAWTSRGYVASSSLDLKRGEQLTLQVETWSPDYSVSVVGDGVLNNTELVSDQIFDRTKYNRPFSAPAWVQTNVNDDFATPFRQDYSLALTATGFKLGAGIRTDYHQATTHQFSPQVTSRAAQVRVTNSTGRIKIIASGYQSHEVEHSQGKKN